MKMFVEADTRFWEHLFFGTFYHKCGHNERAFVRVAQWRDGTQLPVNE